VTQTEISPKLKTQISKYLQNQGYELTEEAKLLGKSGIEHTFDMLAERSDGFTSHIIAICIAAGGNRETELGTIFGFANKAYDTGILDRILVALPELSEEAKDLAKKQRIKVIDGERIESLPELKAKKPTKVTEPLNFQTKGQLVESLNQLGYEVMEKAQVRGKSGIDYTFDILAHIDIDQVRHSLGIDFLSGDKEVNLEQVALFDAKAYDTAIDDKVIVVLPKLNLEAEQFAEQQRIKVLELNQSPVAEPPATEEMPAQAEEAPAKTAKTGSKMLRQMPQPEALQLIPEITARRYNAIPLTTRGNTLRVAMADPTDVFALEAFSTQSRMRIEPVASNLKEVREAIDFNYKGYGEIEKQISSIDIRKPLFQKDR